MNYTLLVESFLLGAILGFLLATGVFFVCFYKEESLDCDDGPFEWKPVPRRAYNRLKDNRFGSLKGE